MTTISNLQAETSEVKAEIIKHCINTSLTPVVTFPNINPLTEDGQIAGGSNGRAFGVAVTCTKGTSLQTTFESTNGWKLKNGTEEISYNIKNYWATNQNGVTSITTLGNGYADQISDRGLYFVIKNTMKPGTYTDTITTTFTW